MRECNLEKYNLVEIFEKGVRGEIPSMTKQDWELVYYLVNESIKTNRTQACREQYVKLRRDGKLNFFRGDLVMNKFENEIVTVEENERCINYYNFRGELVCQLNKNVAESLKDYHQRLYKVKCQSSADMIRSLAKGLEETAINIEKEV